MPELVIMRGLPGAGKSSVVDGRYPTHQVVSADDVRAALGYVYEPLGEPFVRATCLTMARAFMRRGLRDVVIDETNTLLESVALWAGLGREHGYRVVLHDVPAELDICLERRQEIMWVTQDPTFIYRMYENLLISAEDACSLVDEVRQEEGGDGLAQAQTRTKATHEWADDLTLAGAGHEA